jgi:hypothetical protein
VDANGENRQAGVLNLAVPFDPANLGARYGGGTWHGDHPRPVCGNELLGAAGSAFLFAAERGIDPPAGSWRWEQGDDSSGLTPSVLWDVAFVAADGLLAWFEKRKGEMAAAGWTAPGAPPKPGRALPLETFYRTRWWLQPQYQGLTVAQAVTLFAGRMREIASTPGYSEMDAAGGGADFMTLPATWVLANLAALKAIEAAGAPAAGLVPPPVAEVVSAPAPISQDHTLTPADVDAIAARLASMLGLQRTPAT